ncbi:MAG: ABC transporter substrate-binding protein [Pseudomonadota bacterium]
MTRRLLLGLLTTLILASATPGIVRSANAEADQAAAVQFMQTLGDDTLAVLRTDPSFSQALSQLGPLFNQNFDMPTIGRFVLGRYWNQATPGQQQTYTDLFREMVVRTYTRRFVGYTGVTFQVNGSRADGDTDVIVQSQINQGGGAPPVAVDWRVRDYGNGSYKILDVVIEGVSMAATQRSEFASIIQRNGGSIDALLDLMQQNVNQASG